MEIMQEMNGTIVKNDGKGLAETLHLSGMKHQGNFTFTGNTTQVAITIYTKPADDDGETIRILSIATQG